MQYEVGCYTCMYIKALLAFHPVPQTKGGQAKDRPTGVELKGNRSLQLESGFISANAHRYEYMQHLTYEYR